MKNFTHILSMAALLLGAAGCASYPDKMRTVKETLSLEGADESAVSLPESEKGKNRLLALEESGRLKQLMGKYGESSQKYEEAIAFCNQEEERAVVSVGKTAKHVLANTYGNDLSLDYPVVAFERMMLYQLDAFNRLAANDWENVGVDVRNIALARNQAKERFHKDTLALQETIGEAKWKEMTESDAYSSIQNLNVDLVSHISTSLQNAYASYFSGVYYETEKDWSNAKMAYLDALTAAPNHPLLHADVARVTRQLEGTLPAQTDKGDVVVFFEEDYIHAKRSRHFSYGSWFASVIMDIPYYEPMDCNLFDDPEPLAIYNNGKLIGYTVPVCNFSALAARAHQERFKMILARQISRTSVKAITQGVFTSMAVIGLVAAANSGDSRASYILLPISLLGMIGSAAMASSTERADLRSWLLLPRTASISRLSLPPGEYTLTLRHGEQQEKLPVKVAAGRKTLVHCTSVPGIMKATATCAGK